MKRILPSTIQLLRFPFSVFLMPVYWFALQQVPHPDVPRAILIFVILHLLIYPASNGYNSYMDRDESPIGGVKNPQQPTKQLLKATWLLNAIAFILSCGISPLFATGIFLYIAASLAYSARSIRLKRYPVAGYLTVIIFQGAVTFFLVYHGSSNNLTWQVPFAGLLAASLLIGGFYPLTQIYQHEADKRDGVTTISALLGYDGTFVFTGIVYAFAFLCLGLLFFQRSAITLFIILQLFLLPVLIYFFVWFRKVRKDVAAANFENTMRINLIASVCTNLGFITLLILDKFE